MEAKISSHTTIKRLVSCGGVEFLPDMWKTVPKGMEDEAVRNPYLETRDPNRENSPDLPETPDLSNFLASTRVPKVEEIPLPDEDVKIEEEELTPRKSRKRSS